MLPWSVMSSLTYPAGSHTACPSIRPHRNTPLSLCVRHHMIRFLSSYRLRHRHKQSVSHTQSVRQSVRHWGLKLQWAGGHCCSYHVKGTKTNSRGSDYIILTFSCRLPEGQFWPADREFETPGGNVCGNVKKVTQGLLFTVPLQSGPKWPGTH